jgi:hypothetical protein
MAKITISGLRKIIKEELEKVIRENEGFEDDDNKYHEPDVIDRDQLRQMCPAAEDALEGDSNLGSPVDHSDMFWVMSSPHDTNEPELEETLEGDWDSVSCDGKVYLCGSHDDEYGYYWDNGAQEWVSYNF